MKIKTSELSGRALDWAVARCEGRALREPRRGTDEEAAKLAVPFTMHEPVATHKADGSVQYEVQPIHVTRFGNLPGCSAPTISFKDRAGRRAQGSVNLFYFDKAEAELDCQGSQFGFLDGFHPSTDWAQGGPIIKREEVMFHACHTGGINAYLRRTGYAKPGCSWNGPTHLIAAMRCFVASKLGEEVDVPNELCNAS